MIRRRTRSRCIALIHFEINFKFHVLFVLQFSGAVPIPENLIKLMLHALVQVETATIE
jgi:hypothetical protein